MPKTERFADLAGRRKKEVIRLTLAPILHRLKSPVETRVIVEELCEVLDTTETRVISETLFKIAKELGPDQVRQVGEPFWRFGREMRRWQWGPPMLSNDPGAPTLDGLEDLI